MSDTKADHARARQAAGLIISGAAWRHGDERIIARCYVEHADMLASIEECENATIREVEGKLTRLRDALTEASKRCRCNGTGIYMYDNCPYCSDSTFDHECPDPVQRECTDLGCAAIREALLKEGTPTDGT